MAFYFEFLLALGFHLTINCFVTGAVDTRSVADGISEDGAAELQEKIEPGLAEKQKGREG